MNSLTKLFNSKLTLTNQVQFCFGSGKNTRKMGKYRQTPYEKWDIVKGDNVIVNTGRDKGKSGKVLKVYRHQNRILISDVNLKMKRVKGSEEQAGGIKQLIHPIHVSNANLIDPESGLATRVRKAFLADGNKVRIAKRSGAIIHKPEPITYQSRHKDQVDGVKDTDVQTVLQLTYQGEDFGKIKREFNQFIAKKEARESLLVFDL